MCLIFHFHSTGPVSTIKIACFIKDYVIGMYGESRCTAPPILTLALNGENQFYAL
jgi:hypothetical protein